MKKTYKVIALILGVLAIPLTVIIVSVAVIGLLSPVQIFLNDTDHEIAFFPLLRTHQQIYRGFHDVVILPSGEEKRMTYDWESGGAQAAVVRSGTRQIVYCPGESEKGERYQGLSVLTFQPLPVEILRLSAFRASDVDYQSDEQAFRLCVK